MLKQDIIIIGGGGHAKACIDIIESTGLYNILGYVDREETLDSKFNVNFFCCIAQF